MSKQDKALKRERRKADRERRRLRFLKPQAASLKPAAAALAAAAAIAGGTQAYAAPVRFDNPAGAGHFDWAAPFGDDTNWMDFTLPASAQPGLTDGPTSLKLHEDAYNARVGRFDQPIDMQVTGYYLEPLTSGQLIPSGFSWLNQGFGYYYGPALLPEGDSYFGIRFNLGSGYQYGWIGVTRTGSHMDAFAWGYETAPGVSIPAGIPEPGTLAMLALGAAAVAGRRRRA